MKKQPKPIPFTFVFDYLFPMEPEVKPMFGCHALYIGEKIVLILRERENNPESNGVWIATKREHHSSLRKELKSMTGISVFGDGESNWQMIPASGLHFEKDVIRCCELIQKNDIRVGNIPKKKSKGGK